MKRLLGAALCLGVLLSSLGLGSRAAAWTGTTNTFPIAWFDALSRESSITEIAGEGLRAVMPYSQDVSDPKSYLDEAQASQISVLLEIPRDMVRRVDVAQVRRFVATYKSHAALLGWYLADEPSINYSLGPLSPANATRLYNAIKAEDPSHKVAITFASGENAEAYRPAMDVMMYDDYPAYNGYPEFYRFGAWYGRLARAANIASTESAFYPVLQAYGERRNLLPWSAPTRRLPTLREERYMAFSALELGADGLFFWARYRTDPAWVDTTLVPLVNLLNVMRPALPGGGDKTLVSTTRSDVRATTFRTADGATSYIVAIHHDGGTYDVPLKLSGPLAGYTQATLLSDPPQQVPITNGTISQTLSGFEVKVYKLGA